MREIVLDTETTGLDPAEGHRIVEIGAVELFNHLPTGRTYHQFINPERPMPKEAFEVHGLGDEFLRDKPVFATIGAAFLEFIADAQLVIHNAAFDMRFLNFELQRAGFPVLPAARATDTLMISRQKFPGSPASLDALCRRFGVDNSAREKHGALLDSEILAEVYLELIGGRQPDFALNTVAQGRSRDEATNGTAWRPRPRPEPLAPRITQAEAAAHDAFVAKLGDAAIWNRRAGRRN
ncbi:MAG: DNA polymerase III subunit epsilon [Tabrizicola sp.]|uniref:DNA polymerase III subunit epsilon n=1 Tax=Tabrizicola sp. TaxID=2005166 RepID=UPI002733BDE1|nr:DNA polymerase III subunit epsilon [Tabrizicola sp.]MDP3261638.1 DNA polymerase III subunit epsilon [Tabrizicola sp.]MDP3648292.1 DNA polymerase III subunit epsilon [Paracoccaceae bacterium]MDZ4065597.1 DNA polymerase III subunit epsilon [Tabrizicola sp.]